MHFCHIFLLWKGSCYHATILLCKYVCRAQWPPRLRGLITVYLARCRRWCISNGINGSNSPLINAIIRSDKRRSGYFNWSLFVQRFRNCHRNKQNHFSPSEFEKDFSVRWATKRNRENFHSIRSFKSVCWRLKMKLKWCWMQYKQTNEQKLFKIMQ